MFRYLLLLLALGTAFSAAHAAPVDRYWQLGVGHYGGLPGNAAELDVARFQWVYLCFGNVSANEETVAKLNRLLAINPKLKIVVRVWPIMGLGDCRENSYQATFLHYLYQPGVRDKVLAETRRQLRLVIDGVSHPENVVGATFLEELPFHFSGSPFGQNKDGDKVTWDLERFRKEIEAERGQPLRWDDGTRQWWGRKWVQVINEINSTMKQELGPKGLVFYYQQTNHASLDIVPEGTPLGSPMLIPVPWTELLKPGVCDGFFAYPNNQRVWDTYLKLARDHDWYFFSQCSHPPGMRTCGWDECLQMARTRLPQNLGYFFYCEGDCGARQAWNTDRSLPAEPRWHIANISEPLHFRQLLAREQVNLDLLRSYPRLRLQVDLPLQEAATSGWLHARAIVENTATPEAYPDPPEATAKSAAVTLQPPAGFVLDPRHTAPATLQLGDLAPGERRIADWWVKPPQAFKGEVKQPFVFTTQVGGKADNTVRLQADTAPPCGQEQLLGVSGSEWLEAPFRLAEAVRPAITIESVGGPVRHPAVGTGTSVLSYDGTLEAGTQLLLDAAQGARLFARPLVEDAGSARADAGDPSGFRGFSEGYMVANVPARCAVKPGQALKITVAGKSADQGQSLVVMRFTSEGENRDISVVVNAFGPAWGQASQEVTAPADADTLQAIFLYRFKSLGKVWYGPVKVERQDIPAAGLDVSDKVRGVYPTLSADRFFVFRYTDDEPPSPSPRVKVQVRMP
jgi:hypothetical protein